jgi:dTDP-glucose pyrophosphorylase
MNKKIKDRVLVYREDLAFEDIVKKIDINGDGFLALVDESDVLVGVVTDGDIRKAFLKKDLTASKIVNKNPITLPEGTSKEKVVGELKLRRRRHMPIVDAQKRLCDIITLDEVDFETFDQTVVIMAGGMGTRLGDLTRDFPKPMLKVGDKPILEHIVSNFHSHGFRKFAFAVNYKSEIIKSHFKDGSDLGIQIKYLEESEQLGTAGAISLLKEDAISDDVIVINGDVLSNINFADLLFFHQKNQSEITVCSKEISVNIPYAVLDTNEHNELKAFQEKPTYNHWVNSGIYVLSKNIVKDIPKNKFFNMTDVIENAIAQKKVVKVYKTKEYWVDIGQVHDYEKAKQEF